MPARRRPVGADIPSSIDPGQAIASLKRQLERGERLKDVGYDDNSVDVWSAATRDVINAAFGMPGGDNNQRAEDFLYGALGPTRMGMFPEEHQRNYERRLDYRLQLIRSLIEQIEDQMPHVAQDPAMATTVMATQVGRWRRVEKLGSGGQGTVYRVVDEAKVGVDSAQLNKALRSLAAAIPVDQGQSLDFLRDAIFRFASSVDPANQGAQKVLRKSDDARDVERAEKRLRREISAMKEVEHPSLLRIIDANLDEKWYVSEYHERGTLTKHAAHFVGKPRDAILALRSVVEGVAVLHEQKLVHRDIKPDNIFIARDGRLVLGDFGLVASSDDAHTRLSGTFENVGSRDWQPGWTLGEIEEVEPNFDVFTLGKTLWSMVSGKKKLRLWYFREAHSDLEQQFPGTSDMPLLNTLLSKCVVEKPEACLKSARDLLEEMDTTIARMTAGAVDDAEGSVCRICARGTYQLLHDENRGNPHNFALAAGGSGQYKLMACTNCGHALLFFRGHGFMPNAWKRDEQQF